MYSGLDERELARLCSERDRLAESELYVRYAARLLTLCRRYCGSADEARDMMQDTIIRALDRISTYRYMGKGSLYSWLSRIAVNSALNGLRRSKFLFIPLESLRPDDEPEPSGEEVSCISEEKLTEMISGLPKTQRVIFNMYCIEEYSHKEIADMLGISERGSTSLLVKARRNLKKQIGDYLKHPE